MGLKDLAKNAPQKGKGRAVSCLKLTTRIVDQVRAGGLPQAQLVVNTPQEGFAQYRGGLQVQVGDLNVTLFKGDTHCIWWSHQEDEESFTLVFDYLLERLQGKQVVVPATITIEE